MTNSLDIQSLKSLLEIQALQTLGAAENSSPNNLTDNNSIFSDMINELLGNARLQAMPNYLACLQQGQLIIQISSISWQC